MHDANENLYVLSHDAILIPSFQSPLGTPRTMNPLLAHTNEKKKKKKACLFRVLAAKASSTNKKPMKSRSVKACLYNEM